MSKYKRVLKVSFETLGTNRLYVVVQEQSHRNYDFNPENAGNVASNEFEYKGFRLVSNSRPWIDSINKNKQLWVGGRTRDNVSNTNTFSTEDEMQIYISEAKETIKAYNDRYKGSKNTVFENDKT